MDKTKFTINPQLDSEGFVLGNIEIDHMVDYILRIRGLLDGPSNVVSLHDGEYTVISNPPGWNEPGMQPITWADENPDTTSVDAKRAVADVLTRCWNRIPVGEV